MVSAMRRARRSSSSSRSNSRAAGRCRARSRRGWWRCARPRCWRRQAAQAPANSASRRGWLGANSDSSVMAVKASVVKVLASFSPARSAPAHELEVLDDLARVGAQPVVGIVPADEVLDLLARASRRRRRGRRPGPRRCGRARPAGCARPPPPARSRSRAPRSSWPFQPFQALGPTARMSATVSTSSSFSRSGLCTMSAKSRIVLGIADVAAEGDRCSSAGGAR